MPFQQQRTVISEQSIIFQHADVFFNAHKNVRNPSKPYILNKIFNFLAIFIYCYCYVLNYLQVNQAQNESNMESVTTNEKIDEILLILRGVQSQTSQHTEDFEKLEKRLMAFEKSIEFINTQYENQRKITNTVLNKNIKLEAENEVLKKQVGKLQAEINRVHNEVNNLEQYGRRDCVEIN